MSAIADDAHKSNFIVPPKAVEPQAEGHDETSVGAHARPVDVPAIVALRHPSPERRRYFLSSFEPSGDYDAVIVAVTHDGRRRYFTTRDGATPDRGRRGLVRAAPRERNAFDARAR